MIQAWSSHDGEPMAPIKAASTTITVPVERPIAPITLLPLKMSMAPMKTACNTTVVSLERQMVLNKEASATAPCGWWKGARGRGNGADYGSQQHNHSPCEESNGTNYSRPIAVPLEKRPQELQRGGGRGSDGGVVDEEHGRRSGGGRAGRAEQAGVARGQRRRSVDVGWLDAERISSRLALDKGMPIVLPCLPPYFAFSLHFLTTATPEPFSLLLCLFILP